MWIDTHCHLDFKNFNKDRDGVLEKAFSCGVKKVINPAASIQSSRNAIDISARYKNVFAAIGIHPIDADEWTPLNFKIIKDLAKSEKVIAIGETGLDYYRTETKKGKQIKSFNAHIEIAGHLDLPLIIHIRDAFEDAISILSRRAESGAKNKVKGVVHCFSGNIKQAESILDLGLYISFTGNITYPKAKHLREVVSYVPIEKMMVETDAPFLAPQGIRGKRNEPCYVIEVGKVLTEIKKLSLQDVERITSLNAIQLFSIGEEKSKQNIAYPIRDSLYLNITNRCTNVCSFCIRAKTDFIKGHFLRLETEPAIEQIIDAIADAKSYKEVVFCGYGEPTLRLDIVVRVAERLKKMGVPVRLNTNGHGSLIAGKDIVPEIAGRVDKVSISLDAHDSITYNKICKPVWGEKTFDAILEFAKRCLELNIDVELTVVRIPAVDVEKCKEIAHQLGTVFRVREYDEVG